MSAEDIADIQALIDAHPNASRHALSKLLCERWDWRQKNGTLRDMVCRGLMLHLHRSGHIELPAVKQRPYNPLAKSSKQRSKPAPVEVDQTPISGGLRDLGELTWHQVRRTEDEPLVNGLLESHHYLGYTQPVGEHLKFLVKAGERPVACFVWSSAPRHLAPRDNFIGWEPEVRKRNLHLLAYNSRFLILPWVEVKHLASHLLGRMTRMLSAEWEAVYGHPIVFAETFVDTTLHRGTCYRAANWVPLGLTKGRGPRSTSHKPNRTKKEVMGLALCRRFRQKLQEVSE